MKDHPKNMDLSGLTRLRQIAIANPCSEDWSAMEGNDQKRFCAGCGCFVHNIANLDASEAENLLDTSERVCTRLIVDANKGVLTRDGWIPKLLLAGAVAATVAGCSTPTQGAVAGTKIGKVPSNHSTPTTANNGPIELVGDVAPLPGPTLGEVSPSSVKK